MDRDASPIGRRASFAIVALSGAMSFHGVAAAQSRPVTVPVDTVNGRTRPEYDAVGIDLGGFTLYPEANVALVYDDNIYRTATMKRADGFTEIRPRVLLQSSSQRYPVSLEATATVRRYASTASENSERYSVDADAAAEIAPGVRTTANVGFSRELEPRGSAGDLIVGGRPVTYELLQASASASREVGLFGLQAGGTYARYAYDPIKAPGVSLDQRYRNYRSLGGYARAAYAIGPAIAAFVRGGVEHSDYPRLDTLDRRSTGFSVLTGVQLGLGNLVSGSIGIGYLHENYADPRFTDVSGLDYDVSLTWSPTTLVSVNLRGARSIQRSPFEGSAGGIQTTIGTKVDYEVLRQLILTANLNYVRLSYRGLVREDDFYEGSVGARYLVNRTVSATATLTYRKQTSTGIGARNFDGFGATIGVTLHR